MVGNNIKNGIQMGSHVSNQSDEKGFVDYSEGWKLRHLESILHIKIVTNDLKEKPDVKKVGPFVMRLKDGRVFKFDYEHCKVLEGFDTDGSYQMNFRLSDLLEDYVLAENEVIPSSWKDVFEGELEEVMFQVTHENGSAVHYDSDLFMLRDANDEWHRLADVNLSHQKVKCVQK